MRKGNGKIFFIYIGGRVNGIFLIYFRVVILGLWKVILLENFIGYYIYCYVVFFVLRKGIFGYRFVCDVIIKFLLFIFVEIWNI